MLPRLPVMPPCRAVALVSPDPCALTQMGDALAAAGYQPLIFAAAIGLHEVLRTQPPAAIVFDLPTDAYPPAWRWLPLVVLLEDLPLRQVPVVVCMDADRAARVRVLPRAVTVISRSSTLSARSALVALLDDLLHQTRRRIAVGH